MPTGRSVEGATTRTRMKTLHNKSFADEGLRHDKIINIEIMVVLSIRNRALETFLHVSSDALARKFKIGERARCHSSSNGRA